MKKQTNMINKTDKQAKRKKENLTEGRARAHVTSRDKVMGVLVFGCHMFLQRVM